MKNIDRGILLALACGVWFLMVGKSTAARPVRPYPCPSSASPGMLRGRSPTVLNLSKSSKGGQATLCECDKVHASAELHLNF